MVKCVGFLVAELPEICGSDGHDMMLRQSPEEAYALPPSKDTKSWEIKVFDKERVKMYKFTADQRYNAVNISRSLAMAYVMDQANILRYNEETLKKVHNSTYAYPESIRSQLSDNCPRDSSSGKLQNFSEPLPLDTSAKDLEMPMPPKALAPLKQNEVRPCNVSNVLIDLVEVVRPLAHKQQNVWWN